MPFKAIFIFFNSKSQDYNTKFLRKLPYFFAKEAAINPLNTGCALFGRLLNGRLGVIKNIEF